LHRFEAKPGGVHPSGDVSLQTGCQAPDSGLRQPRSPILGLARRLLYQDRLRNVLLPPRETFLLDRRVQERKGLHAFFFRPSAGGGRRR
jgi:hypothetical protein